MNACNFQSTEYLARKILTNAVLLDRILRPRSASGVTSSLPPRRSTLAPVAGPFTRAVNKPRRVRRRTSRTTKADRRLRKMAENADPGRSYTLNEIADVMGITRERVRQIEMKALRTFRNRLVLLVKGEDVSPDDLRSMLQSGGER